MSTSALLEPPAQSPPLSRAERRRRDREGGKGHNLSPEQPAIGQSLPDQKLLESKAHVNHPAQYKIISNSGKGQRVTVRNTATGKTVVLDRANPHDAQALQDILKWKEKRQALDPRKKPMSIAPAEPALAAEPAEEGSG